MNNLLNLNIDQAACLQFLTEVKDNEFVDLDTFISVWLKQGDARLCLQRVSVGFDLDDFAEHLQQCLDNKIGVPKELDNKVDLGFLWNEHIQKIILAEEAGKPLKSWDWIAGHTVFLQCRANGDKSCNTFLYNDHQGNIILQISAAYPWFFKDAPSSELNISYDDWLPKHKILYKIIIPRKVAQKWVKQLIQLHATLDARMTCCK